METNIVKRILANAFLARAVFDQLPVDDKFRLARVSRDTFAAFRAECSAIVGTCHSAVRAVKAGSDILFRKRFTAEHANIALIAAAKFGRPNMAIHALTGGATSLVRGIFAAGQSGRADIFTTIMSCFLARYPPGTPTNDIPPASELGVTVYSRVLTFACKSGHVEFVRQILDLAAAGFPTSEIENSTNGTEHSSAAENMDSVRRLMSFEHLGARRNDSAGIIALTAGRLLSHDHVRAAYQNGSAEIIALVDGLVSAPDEEKFVGACRGGHLGRAESLAVNGVDAWTRGLGAACRGGHLVLAEFCIVHGARADAALFDACLGGSVDVVNLVIAHGANNWTSGLVGACLGGRLDLVDLMISRGASVSPDILCDFCPGRSDIAHKLMPHIEWSGYTAWMVAAGGFPEEAAAYSVSDDEWDGCLPIACRGGHVGMAEFVATHGSNRLCDGLASAAWCDRIPVGRMLLARMEQAGEKTDAALNQAFWYARMYGNYAFMLLLIEAGCKEEIPASLAGCRR